MSDVLDYVREKDPRFKDVSDDDLTLYLGSKKPDFLKDDQFKTDFQGVVADRSIKMATEGTGDLLKVLTNPAAGEAAKEGRKQIAKEQLSTEMEQTRAQAKNNAVASGLIGATEQVVGGIAEMNPANLLKRTLNIPAQLSGSPLRADVPAVSPETVRKGLDFLDPHSYDEPGSAREGVKQALSGLVSGLTSPDQVAALMLGTKEPEAVARLFQVEAASQIPEATKQLVDAVKTGDRTEVAKAITGFAATAGIPVAIEAGMRKSKPPTDLGNDALVQSARNAAPVAPMTAAVVAKQAGKPDFVKFRMEGTEDLSKRPIRPPKLTVPETTAEEQPTPPQEQTPVAPAKEIQTWEDAVDATKGMGSNALKTVADVQKAFPALQLSREAARALGRGAFGDKWSKECNKDSKEAPKAPEAPQTPPEAPKPATEATKASSEPSGEPLDPAKTGPITAAAYRDPKTGEVTYGANHPEILRKLGISGYETPESRNTPDFGYKTENDTVRAACRGGSGGRALETGLVWFRPRATTF